MKIVNGSRWTDGNGRTFIIIGTMIIEGQSWVYYRLEKQEEHFPREFSCFEESFLSRFSRLPE